jgi:hypothetical protein
VNDAWGWQGVERGKPLDWQWWRCDDDAVDHKDAAAVLHEACDQGCAYMVFLCLC